MFTKNRKAILAGFGTALLGGLLASTTLLEAKINPSDKESKLQAYIKFTQILNLIENQYVDEVNTTDLINKSLFLLRSD